MPHPTLTLHPPAPQDFTLAYKHLMAAAEGGLPDAFFYLGVMHARGLGVRRRNAARAFSYFSLAASAGHLPAMYNAAAMHAAGRGTGRACRPAAALFKAIAERGRAAAPLQRGHAHFFAGRYPQALLEYLRAADMGIELGQANAAWVLESGYAAAGAGAAAAAFQLHRRSAQQGNVQSLLQVRPRIFCKLVMYDYIKRAQGRVDFLGLAAVDAVDPVKMAGDTLQPALGACSR